MAGSSFIPAFPVYIFDVDGTLVDSAEDICGAIQGVLSKTAANHIPDSFLRGYIGRHLNDLFNHLLPGLSAGQLEAMVQEYRTIYAARDHQATKLYDGVLETLAKLPGRKTTATTKGTPTTRIVLERFHLLPYFDHIQGTDGFPAKPQPDVIFKAIAGLNAKPEECLFVGDSAADMEAAQRAGVQSCAVTYGYGRREELAKWSPTFWLEHLGALTSGFTSS